MSKKLYINPDKVQAVEVWDNGKAAVHMEGSYDVEDDDGQIVREPKVFTNSKYQAHEVSRLLKGMITLRGEQKQ